LTTAHARVRSIGVRAIRQQAFRYSYRQRFAAADFQPAPCNAAALTWLARTGDWPEGRLALWGDAGCGKTHLLHLWAERTEGAVVLGGSAFQEAFDMPANGGIALDDVDACESGPTLLHLLNAASEARLPVLMAGRTPPSRWPTRVPDLASRLRAVAAVEIGAADDGLLRALLIRLAGERQLAIPEAVHEWLLRRLPRSPAAFREAVARLDEAAFAKGSTVTRPLAATALAGMIDDPP
jgi:chromosomal replication initiation ATPase DnaA